MAYYKAVAYDVLGAQRAEVPAPLSMSVTWPGLNQLATLTIVYEPTAPRYPQLDEAEIAFVYVADDGTEIEDYGCRFHPTEDAHDAVSRAPANTYTYAGIGGMLFGECVYVPNNLNPPRGSVKPLWKFAHASVGRVIGEPFDRAQLRGWGIGLSRGFGVLNDSAGVPWPTSELRVQFPTVLPLYRQWDQMVNANLIDWSTLGRTFHAWPPHTFLDRDLEGVSGGPILYYAKGVDDGSERKSFAGIVTHALVQADDGRQYEVANPYTPAHSPMGRMLVSLEAPGVLTQADAQGYAALTFSEGANPVEQISRKWTLSPGKSTVWPIRDFRVGDRFPVQRGWTSSGEAILRNLRCTGAGITIERNKPATVWASFGSRLEKRTDRLTRRIIDLSEIAIPGSTPGTPAAQDERVPEKVTGLTVTGSQYLDDRNRTRYRMAGSFAPVTVAVPNDLGEVQPIEIGYYDIARRRQGAGTAARQVFAKQNPTTTGGVQDNPQTFVDPTAYDVDSTSWIFSVRAVAWNGKGIGAWSDDFTVTTPGDEDRDAGPNQVLDAGFRSTLRNAARAASTSGLSFVADGSLTVAQLTTTGSVLKTGAIRSANDKSGRFRVRAGDKITATCRMRRAGAAAATGRVQVVLEYDDGSTATLTAGTLALTTSYADVGGTTTAVTQDGWAGVQVDCTTISRDETKTGPAAVAVYASSPYGFRQAKTGDIEAGAITADLINVDSLNGVHITGLVIDAGTLNAATINGAVITAGKLTTGTNNIVIDNDSIALGDSALSFVAGRATFSKGLNVTNALTVGLGTQTSGLTNLGNGVVCGVGQTLGFFGSAGVSIRTLNMTAITDQATRDAAINSLRSVVLAYNLALSSLLFDDDGRALIDADAG